ncbi:MAG TPA: UbiD family decarboxylase [Candidatus Acidoferrales bacterium]|nr:UbiD family decarboxylase [Candidatus Acidoferrales bacterium]
MELASPKASGANGSASPRHRLPYRDLREWIAEVEKLGELRRVDGATCEQDIGMVTELFQHDEHAPAALFDDIPGFPKGFRVLANFFGARRKNMTFGFPTDLNKVQLSEALVASLQAAFEHPVPFRVVKDGPVLQNVLRGADVDVLKFPTPKWHEGDGGRYIGTGCFNVTKDPDSDWINCGTYRAMIHDRTNVGFHISPGKHGGGHRDKYFARGEPMPTCMVIGVDPFTFLMAGSDVPHGLCEYDVVGAYRGEPMDVILGEVTGLPFPANAEIVLEGFCYGDRQKAEGPFGEWTGFYSSSVRESPVMEVKAIYYRNDPIILGSPPQRPPDEHSRYLAIVRSAQLKDSIKRSGVPDVQSVWCHEVGGSRMFTGVSIKQKYPGHATQAGFIAAQCGVGAFAGKYVVVVDEDIDVTDLDQLLWAMCFRSDPATSVQIIRDTYSTKLDPSIPPWKKDAGDTTNSRAIINACRPFHWKGDYPTVNVPDPELYKLAREKWGHLLK